MKGQKRRIKRNDDSALPSTIKAKKGRRNKQQGGPSTSGEQPTDDRTVFSNEEESCVERKDQSIFMTEEHMMMEQDDLSKMSPSSTSGSSDGSKKKKKTRRKRKNINVKTLFVGGLPMDAKPREIYLMFRKFTGYQGSILKMYGKEGKTATPVAFVTFETREEAETAKSELHGVRFDEQIAKTLKIEFAKSNTKDAENAMSRVFGTKIPPEESRVIHPPTVPLDDVVCSSATVQPMEDITAVAWPPVLPSAMFCDMTGSMYPTPIPTPLHVPTYQHGLPVMPPPFPNSLPTFPAPGPVYTSTLPAYTPSVLAPPVYAPAPPAPYPSVYPPHPPISPTPPPQTSSFIPNPEVVPNEECSPCTTLFVANLGENANEEELKQLFSTIPSFCRLKMHHNKGMKPVTFVQYSDLASAMQAKTIFRGRTLLSTETGGLRIEYAKKDMGEIL